MTDIAHDGPPAAGLEPGGDPVLSAPTPTGLDPASLAAGVGPGPDATKPSIKKQASRAMIWSAGSRTGVQLIQLVTLLVFARVLSPADVGLAAIVAVISNFALLISDVGLGAAIVHDSVVDRRKLDSVFWLNAIAGVVLTLIVAGLAKPLAILFHKPSLTGLILFASLTYTVALTVVPLALLEREMNLKPAALCELAAAFISSAVGISAGFLGCGAYSILIVAFMNQGLLSVLYLVVTKYTPTSGFNRQAMSEVWKYGRGISGFNIINYWTRNSDTVLLGEYASTAAVGYYSRAYQLMLVPVQQIQFIIGRVLFPALSRMKDDPKRLKRAHRSALLLSSAMCAPLAAGLAACSNDFVLACLGHKWAPMIPILAILASTGVQQVFQGTVGTLYQAIGRTDLMFKSGLVFTGLTLAAFVIGVHWGAIGMATAVAVRGWVLLPITLSIPLRLIDDSAFGILASLRSVIVAVLVEVGAVLAVFFSCRHLIPQPGIRLVLEILAGAAGYLVVLQVMAPTVLSDLRLTVRRGN